MISKCFHLLRTIIGCFCAASNVTGIVNDDLAITAVLHAHGALAFWDYATAAPYVNIDVNPKVPGLGLDSKLFEKDAVFFSAHKFVGGVQTPGVLVAKKRLFTGGGERGEERPPNGAGGGAVFFVGREGHRYLQVSAKNRCERNVGKEPPWVSLRERTFYTATHQVVGRAFVCLLF